MRLIFFSIFLIVIIHSTGRTQSFIADIGLLEKHDHHQFAKDNNFRLSNQVNDHNVIQYKHRSRFAKYNPMSLFAISSMYIYQKVISPQLFRHCLYHRSCSNYSKGAIQEFGLIKGIFMSADRLLRCNTDAIKDIPPEDFDMGGMAIDEPSKYHISK